MGSLCNERIVKFSTPKTTKWIFATKKNRRGKEWTLRKETLVGYNVHYLIDLSDFIDDNDKFNNNSKNTNSDSNRLEVRHVLFNLTKLYRQLQRQFQQL